MNHTENTGNAEPQLGNHSQIPQKHEWYSRGYLPHRDRIGLLQSITFRLADSLPQEKLAQLKQELTISKRTRSTKPQLGIQQRKQIETWLDMGMGCCALGNTQMATVMQQTLIKFDGEKYKLIAWCIMPNHVHVLIEPLISLSKIVQSWKSFTGRWAMQHNAELGLGVPGKALWMREYWDRYIRNEKHLDSVIDYIHQNPVKAQLCDTATQWQWSSARWLNSGNAKPQLGTTNQLSGNAKP